MQGEVLKNAVKIAKYIITEKVCVGDTVLDATVGNGHDTDLLATLVGEKGKVYGFDIQENAIKRTKARLIDKNMDKRVRLIQDSHANIDKYIEEQVDLAIFNLGYLPGSDHHIVTTPQSTIPAIEKSLHILKRTGILLVLVYSGHTGGEEEREAVDKLLRGLEQRKYNSVKLDFINQVNKPPMLYAIEKK